jgi:hypothetical protein
MALFVLASSAAGFCFDPALGFGGLAVSSLVLLVLIGMGS